MTGDRRQAYGTGVSADSGRPQLRRELAVSLLAALVQVGGTALVYFLGGSLEGGASGSAGARATSPTGGSAGAGAAGGAAGGTGTTAPATR